MGWQGRCPLFSPINHAFFVLPVSFFEVLCQTNIRLLGSCVVCDSCLINNTICVALPRQGALAYFTFLTVATGFLLSFVNSLKFYCCALKFRPPCLVDIYSWLWPLIYLSQNGVYDRGGSACQLVQGNLCQRQGCCPLFSSITHQYTIGGEVLVN